MVAERCDAVDSKRRENASVLKRLYQLEFTVVFLDLIGSGVSGVNVRSRFRSGVYAAPFVELSSAITAFAGSTLGLQPLIVPSRVAKINGDGPDLPFLETTKPVDVFPTMPVGEPGGNESLGAFGIVTTSGTVVP